MKIAPILLALVLILVLIIAVVILVVVPMTSIILMEHQPFLNFTFSTQFQLGPHLLSNLQMSGLSRCFCRNSWHAALALQHFPSFPPFLETAHHAATWVFPNLMNLILSGVVSRQTCCSSGSHASKSSFGGGCLSGAGTATGTCRACSASG